MNETQKRFAVMEMTLDHMWTSVCNNIGDDVRAGLPGICDAIDPEQIRRLSNEQLHVVAMLASTAAAEVCLRMARRCEASL